MSWSKADAVLVCCSQSDSAARWKLFLVSVTEHQFQWEDCGFILDGRMTRKYVLCEHSRSLFFLVYIQSMKHVNIVAYAHLCIIPSQHRLGTRCCKAAVIDELSERSLLTLDSRD